MLLHRLVVDFGLARTQEGYAEAAGIAHREFKAPAKGLVLGLRKIATAALRLQAAGRGQLGRRETRKVHDMRQEVQKQCEEQAARAAERRAAEAARKHHHAALAISAGARGQADRRGVREQKQAMRDAAAVVLEALRVHQNRLRLPVAFELSRARRRSAVIIQTKQYTRVASLQARSAYTDMREKAIEVQSAMRGLFARKEAAAKREENTAEEQRAARAATSLASGVRGFHDRQFAAQKRKEKLALEMQMEHAATRIQALTRGHWQLKIYDTLRDAAISIESISRGRRGRRAVQQAQQEQHAAVVIGVDAKGVEGQAFILPLLSHDHRYRDGLFLRIGLGDIDQPKQFGHICWCRRRAST